MNANPHKRACPLVAALLAFSWLPGSTLAGMRVDAPSAVHSEGKAAHAVVACADVGKLAMPRATITHAEAVAAGQYQVPEKLAQMMGRPGLNLAGRSELGTNPAFCRIAATLKPSADSDIKIEVWLPQSAWNGKYLGVSNFGWAGSLMYAGMLAGLQDGYATASTDTGHDSSTPEGNGGRFALGHPEKIIDYAYRATHEMTVDAKALIQAFYGKRPRHSYIVGCSLGGLEALIEAKRFPTDYDGVVAGAPPNPLARFNALQIWPDWLINQDPSRLIPQAKYTMIHEAVIKACASPLGQKDGVVEQPEQCGFDPAQLLCKGGDAPDCLTAPQVLLMQQTYTGPVNPRTHEVIFPGAARGAELEMFFTANGTAPSVAVDLYRYLALQNPDWDWKNMDWDRDVSAAIDKVGPLMHVDADLKPFFEHGGKLVLYIGWNDGHNPQQLIEYYKSVATNTAADPSRSAMRLFTIPGMGHCAGGAGCDTFDKIGVIDRWVDQGVAPDRVIASKFEDGKLVRSRPLCAYPKIAHYKGSGDTHDAANFECTRSEAQ